MSANLLTVCNLRRHGLQPVDLQLAAGETISITGPSGAGKSLLLRAIADLDPNEGEVELDGKQRSRFSGPDWRRAVTYVAATPGWWAPTVVEHFRAEEVTKATELLQRLGLPGDVKDWPVERLSTGEGQRIALARAFVVEPQILLLDEPTAALDGTATAAVETILRERVEAGVALLFVSHDPEQAARLASRHLVMEKGGCLSEQAASYGEER